MPLTLSDIEGEVMAEGLEGLTCLDPPPQFMDIETSLFAIDLFHHFELLTLLSIEGCLFFYGFAFFALLFLVSTWDFV